jgi:5-methylcytosine-specific restriction endonuclease McrA
MSKQVKEWARRKRRELIEELGGKCAACGEVEYEKLTFDHIHGKDWETTGLSTDQRMCRYRKESKLKLLQILCLICNSKKGTTICERDAVDISSPVQEQFLGPNEPF